MSAPAGGPTSDAAAPRGERSSACQRGRAALQPALVKLGRLRDRWWTLTTADLGVRLWIAGRQQDNEDLAAEPSRAARFRGSVYRLRGRALRRLDAWLDDRRLEDTTLASYLAEFHDQGRAPVRGSTDERLLPR